MQNFYSVRKPKNAQNFDVAFFTHSISSLFVNCDNVDSFGVMYWTSNSVECRTRYDKAVGIKLLVDIY